MVTTVPQQIVGKDRRGGVTEVWSLTMLASRVFERRLGHRRDRRARRYEWLLRVCHGACCSSALAEFKRPSHEHFLQAFSRTIRTSPCSHRHILQQVPSRQVSLWGEGEHILLDCERHVEHHHLLGKAQRSTLISTTKGILRLAAFIEAADAYAKT